MTDAPAFTPESLAGLFTGPDGQYRFARWGRPLAPVMFGLDDATLGTMKAALQAVCALAGHSLSETDPELGANLMVFALRDWDELRAIPDLGRMIPDLDLLIDRLAAADAQQYRAFRFDGAGAIRAAFVFLRIAGPITEMPAETLALTQAVQVMLLWSEAAFARQSPLALLPGSRAAVLRPEIAAVIRAAYDRVLPVAASDPAHALRIYARTGIAP